MSVQTLPSKPLTVEQKLELAIKTLTWYGCEETYEAEYQGYTPLPESRSIDDDEGRRARRALREIAQ